MGYILSDKISVFPCGGRNATYDQFARLTTEYNLVSIINRLVDKKSFIVTSHNAFSGKEDAPSSSYMFNIGGYLFNVEGGIKFIINSLGEPSFEENVNGYLCATIKVDDGSSNSGYV
jgi:hypothetical protein